LAIPLEKLCYKSQRPPLQFISSSPSFQNSHFVFFSLISFKYFVCLACNLYLNLQQIKRYVFPLLYFTSRFFLVPIKKRHLRHLPMLPLPARFHSAEVGCLHSGINSLASMRHNGRTTFQCKFFSVLLFFLIIT
jgi:hypothetical protein